MDCKGFIASSEATCTECDEDFGRKAWITHVADKGAVCLSCADLDHLVFLPSGDAALTRRSAKYSTLRAIVLQWSKARKRYERQRQPIEEADLQKAEEECLVDADQRARQRQKSINPFRYCKLRDFFINLIGREVFNFQQSSDLVIRSLTFKI